ncbi:hypothetical protein DFH06DRAFT_1476443 [Mycena polygramma]|nr:hypothetical protein DFH06DRAFT_1476443 [Mycena polygramma]
MLENVSAPVPCTVLATAQLARYAALAVRLMYPQTRGDLRPRRSVRIRPSPLGRFPVWTPAALEAAAVSSLPALAAAPSRQPLALLEARATLGLGHPSTASKRPCTPVALCASIPLDSPRTRGRTNIGLGHPSTSPRRPIAPVGPRPCPSSSTLCSYAHATAQRTPRPTTSRRVTPTSDSSRCAAKQPGGALPSISAPAQRSTSSGSPQAGTTQSPSGAVKDIAVKEEKEVGREFADCGDVAMQIQIPGHLAAIGFKTLF